MDNPLEQYYNEQIKPESGRDFKDIGPMEKAMMQSSLSFSSWSFDQAMKKVAQQVSKFAQETLKQIEQINKEREIYRSK